MSRINWDDVGKKRYEAGVDRGVLYLKDGRGVPWNGLVNVEEDMSSVETNPYYYDGIKYLDTRYPGDFEGSITAYTYPDEFLEFDGYAKLDSGVLLAHQPVYSRFGLSYRTKIGNDVDGIDHGYKIHILYNLVAIPQNRSYASMQEQPEAIDFSWKISGVPEPIPGHRPTVHIVIDTTTLNPYLVRDVEDLLYGVDAAPPVVDNDYDGGTPTTEGSPVNLDGGTVLDTGFGQTNGGTAPDAHIVVSGTVTSTVAKLPPLQELVDLLNSWVLIDIVDNGDGTWTASGPPEFVEMLDETTFRIQAAGKMLDADTYQISTTHSL
jgi:hypothetical protein